MPLRPWFALAIAVLGTSRAIAQQPAFATVPGQTVYEYQLNYELPWQRWYGGPGLSLGGTMPTQGALGYSSLNGLPLPAPLGAGVYVNAPAAHGVMMGPAWPMGPVPMGAMGPAMGPVPMGGMGPAGPMGPMGPAPGFGALPPGGQPPRSRQAPASSPAARRISVEQQNAGDELLRRQAWTQAYVRYRNAADLAPERPEPHFRLGLAFAAMKQYASAIREIKRSLDLDPTLPQSGETLATIFGADNTAFQSQVVPAVAQWAREDVRDTDRLFLLGVLLHFAEDPRGSEIFEAVRRTTGGNDYVAAFVTPARKPAGGGARALPDLNEFPLPHPPELDLPPSPMPLPEPPTPDPALN